MQLSKLEEKAYTSLRKNQIWMFKAKDLEVILGINKINSYNLIKALKKKNIIKSVKGFLFFKDADDFAVGSGINWPSYVSFWSALNYYGFSDQTPKKIFFAAAKYTKDVGEFKYITLSKKRFFGYQKIGNIIIAEREKAIIDSLLFPKYSGGIKEITASIRNGWSELDIKKLIDYAFKVESKSVLRRLGFILESIDFKNKNLKKIQEHIGNGYELLDPSLGRRNNLNNKWLLDVNIEVKK
ncbi:MAG: hypothetical protein WC533_01860 [Candidatus Pacearchaeota archaeon]